MNSVRRKRFFAAALGLAACLAVQLLGGCAAVPSGGSEGFGPDASPALASPSSAVERTPPPVVMPETGEVQTHAESGGTGGYIDTSNTADGYVGAAVTSPERCKLRVVKGTAEEMTAGTAPADTYDIDSDGSVSYFPLTRGDGHYTVILYYSAGSADANGNEQYYRLATAEADVVLSDEFAPFLRPSRVVRYTPESECVALSHEITAYCANDLEVTRQIYAWITENVDYDNDKADIIKAGGLLGYEPDPDETLAARLGICYDYAALAAAMLRANGIPTKLVKGDVMLREGSVYHAWNLVWVEGEGWIAVGLAPNVNDWTRVDVTFAAGGAAPENVGDGDGYTDLLYY